jgi:four helix bundle protein
MLADFRKLEIWKKSRVLVKNVYLVLEDFPKTEIYGLVSQLKRCAISVPSNIAEGCGRRTNKDLNRFLDIANGSLCELETQICLANDLDFITIQKMEEIQKKQFKSEK